MAGRDQPSFPRKETGGAGREKSHVTRHTVKRSRHIIQVYTVICVVYQLFYPTILITYQLYSSELFIIYTSYSWAPPPPSPKDPFHTLKHILAAGTLNARNNVEKVYLPLVENSILYDCTTAILQYGCNTSVRRESKTCYLYIHIYNGGG